MPIRQLSIIIALSALTACGGDGQSARQDLGLGPAFLAVSVPKNTYGVKLSYLGIRPMPFIRDGMIQRLDVSIGPRGSKPSKRTPVVKVDQQLTLRVAKSLKNGKDSAAASGLAMQIARATYCRTGSITPNTTIKRYNKPKDIQAIINETNRLGKDAIPSGLKGEAIPSAHFRTNSGPHWVVSFNCSSPNPYR